MKIDEPEIYDQVRAAIADTLRTSPQRVTPDALLFHDLGAESLDYVDIEFRLEKHFGITLYHGSAVERIAELLAPAAVEQDGVLTPFGAAVLRQRMPEIGSERLQAGQPVSGIEGAFTPRTWVRVVREALDARPEACSTCGSTDLEPSKPSVLVCRSCNAEVHCPTGEECLERWVLHFTKQMSRTAAADAA